MNSNTIELICEIISSTAIAESGISREDTDKLTQALKQKMYTNMALRTQLSEIEQLKNKAIGSMGTDHEMKFSDIESGMLSASLADGRRALKEVMESIPVEAPASNEGTKMKDQGIKKKHNDDAGACRRRRA